MDVASQSVKGTNNGGEGKRKGAYLQAIYLEHNPPARQLMSAGDIAYKTAFSPRHEEGPHQTRPSLLKNVQFPPKWSDLMFDSTSPVRTTFSLLSSFVMRHWRHGTVTENKEGAHLAALAVAPKRG